MKPLAIDLFCGLGGWSSALLAEGWDAIGFDIERHRYPERNLPPSEGRKVAAEGVDFNNPNVDISKNRSFNYANECMMRDAPLTGGWIEYPAQLVIQDVLTLHGSQFKSAGLIVASPPCQEYSYMAMPWSLAKAKAIRDDTTGESLIKLNRLFDACFRIQREACEAAGRHIPLIVENVRGAQAWVGRSRWNYGSFHLFGDVPALMPIASRASKVPAFRFDGNGGSFQTASVNEHIKNEGGSWFVIGSPGQKVVGQNPVQKLIADYTKAPAGTRWFNDGPRTSDSLASSSSKSPARKAASAMIAKIPEPLARHIARTFYPRTT